MFDFQALASVLFQGGGDEGAVAAMGFSLFIYLCCIGTIVLLTIAAYWRIFTKAGKPGWAAIIPIYNLVILLEIVGRPLWFVVLFLIPGVNILAAILLCIDLALSFGKDTLYGVLLFFFSLIMFLVLAFSDAQYVGPMAAKNPIFPAT